MGILARRTNRATTAEVSTYQLAGTRAPTAGTIPAGFSAAGLPMVTEWDAETALKWGYYANVFVFASAKAIASDLSALPFRIGNEATGEFDVAHPMARHLGPPPGGANPVTSGRKIIAWSIVQYLITGKIGWEIEVDARGRPLAYWPLPASQLRAIPSQSGSTYFTGYEYGPQGRHKTLAVDRVFYTWEPAQDDWRQPESRLQAARLDVSVAVMQDRYDHAFLKNDARPAGILVHERFAEVDERNAWRQQFTSSHQGPDNAGRLAFAESEGGEGGVAGAIDLKQLGLSQHDAEFIRRYDQKLRAITVAMGVPLSRLGDASARTFSNAGEEMSMYWHNTLLPLKFDLQDALNIQLLPKYGTLVGENAGYFDTSDVEALQEGATFQKVGVPALVDGALVTRDEGRAMIGKGPHPDPEVGASTGPLPAAPIAISMTPPAIPPAPSAADTTPPAPAPASPVPPAGAAQAVTGEQREGDHAYQPSAGQIRRLNIGRAAESQMTTMENQWERSFQRLFAKQLDATVARLEGKRGRQALAETRVNPSASAIFDPTFWATATEEMVTALYEQVLMVGGARVSDKFGIAFDLEAPWAQVLLTSRPNQLAGQVTDTTYRAIQSAMADGVVAGDSIPQIAARIQAVFDYASATRATTIARTEVVSSYNYAGTEIAKDLPADVVGGQEWIATGGPRTREAHAEADGQIVPVGEAFDVGGEQMSFPGDPSGSAENVVNCRCTVGFLTPDEMGRQ